MTAVDIDTDADVLEEFGPAMRALSPRRREFVRALIEKPRCSLEEAAKIAGFGGESAARGGKKGGHVLRQIGWRLSHDEKIIAAIYEESSRDVRSNGLLLGLQIMRKIAETDGHKDQARMAEALVGRAGMPSVMEFRHRDVSSDDKGIAWQLKRLMELAELLGIDGNSLKAKLFGENAGPMKQIEGARVVDNAEAG